ncbi:MAG: DUF3151 family protein [Nitriliruptorales bacterium]|nr:DUF3151 family protein [Nitriliruptorales bacterium]
MTDLPMADRPEVVLPAPPDDAARALEDALAADEADRRDTVGRVAAEWPTYLDAWARLSEHGRDPIERYAFARVGYHRGLDAIRKHGWGGNGYVRWQHETNRGFLRCLVRLRATAGEIDEQDEVRRIDEFLHTLDPDWDDANV